MSLTTIRDAINPAMVAEANVDKPAMKSSISEEEQKLSPLKMISLLNVLYNTKERPPTSVANTDNRIRVRDFMTDQNGFLVVFVF